MNKTLTILIPVHTLENGDKELLTAALNSCFNQTNLADNVSVVTNSDTVKNFIDEYTNKTNNTVSIIINESDNQTFQGQVNYAANQIETEYFTVLEFDDAFNERFIERFNEYSPHYVADMYLPITVEKDFLSGNMVHITNAGAWAHGATDAIGKPDLQGIQNDLSYNLTGTIINVEAFNEVGGLKNNIKLTFAYEFFLRFAYNDKKMFVLPYIGYNHTINRPNSILQSYKDENSPERLTQGEATAWYEMAKQEYYYTDDREVVV